jgi:hypothetical protein
MQEFYNLIKCIQWTLLNLDHVNIVCFKCFLKSFAIHNETLLILKKVIVVNNQNNLYNYFKNWKWHLHIHVFLDDIILIVNIKQYVV